MQKILSFVLIVLLVAFMGCKKDESPTTPGTGVGPSVPHATFKGPNTTDPKAQTAISFATSMNGVMASSTVFSSLPAQQNGNTSKWTYSAGGETVTFTGIKQNDGSYTWTYVYTGTIDGTLYTNFTMWQGTTSADGKNGNWTFYEPGHAGKTDELVYTTDASNVLTGTWSNYNTDGTLSAKWIIVNNANGSGSVVIYGDGIIQSYRAEWIADQSGQEWYYEADGITIITHNTWVKS